MLISENLVSETGFRELASKTTHTICFGMPDESLLDPRHTIINRPPSTCAKSKQIGATCIGLVFSNSWTCRSCLCNAFTALVKRHGVRQPIVTQDILIFPGFLVEIRGAYIEYMSHSYDSWFDKWKTAQKRQITRSIDLDSVRSDRLKSFVKRELGFDMPTRPRLIQAYINDATKALYGREFYCFQKALASVCQMYEISPGITITMASGLNARQIAEWMTLSIRMYPSAKFLECDGANWDATMQKMHHLIKLLHMKQCSPELAEFVDSCYTCVGTVRDGWSELKYKLDGTVKSGHNDTTSGNTLINMLIVASTMYVLNMRGNVIVAGDDSLVVVDGDFDIDQYITSISAYGIVPKARKFSSVDSVSFISGMWLRQPNDSFAFIPFLGRLLCKLWWTVSPPVIRKTQALTDFDFRNYRHSVVSGLKPSVGGLPVFKQFLASHDYVDAEVVEIDKTRFTPYHTGVQVDYEYSLQVMAERYDVSKYDLIAFADFLTDLQGKAGFASHSVASKIISVDCASLMDRIAND